MASLRTLLFDFFRNFLLDFLMVLGEIILTTVSVLLVYTAIVLIHGSAEEFLTVMVAVMIAGVFISRFIAEKLCKKFGIKTILHG